LLPSVLHVATEVVYLATVASVLIVNFLVFRYGIFHNKPAVPERDQEARAFDGDCPSRTSVEQPTHGAEANAGQRSHGPLGGNSVERAAGPPTARA
jgi:hypothetical protein